MIQNRKRSATHFLKRIGIYLAAILIVAAGTLTAAAATENEIIGEAMTAVGRQLQAGEAYLSIADDRGDLGDAQHTIRLLLDNAHWAPAEAWLPREFRFYHEGRFVANGSNAAITVNRVTNTRLDVTLTLNEEAIGSKADEIHIPLLAEVQGAGAARLTLDPMNTQVSRGAFTFVEGVQEATRTTVAEIIIFGPAEQGQIGTITVSEMELGALNLAGEMRFKLPAGFYWVENTEITLRGSGGFARAGSITLTQEHISGNELRFSAVEADIRRPLANRTGSLEITGLTFMSENGQFGEVALRVGGSLAVESLTIAKHVDYGVTVSAEGLDAVIVSGRFEARQEGQTLRALQIEEEVAGSLFQNRPIDVVFPTAVKVMAVRGVDPVGFSQGDSAFTFMPNVATDPQTTRISQELLVEVVTEPAFTGEIVAQVSGGGIPEPVSVVLAEAIKPVQVEAQSVTWLAAGALEARTPEIRLVEVLPGGMMEGDLEIQLGVGEWATIPEIQIISGDIALGNAAIEENLLRIPVTAGSASASEVVIKPAMVKGFEMAAFGDYIIRFGGDALLEKSMRNLLGQETYTEKSLITLTDAVEVIFTVDQPHYWLGAERVSIDAPPFISEGRLMVPVTHVSRALGIPAEAVVWNSEESSVSVTAGETTLKMIIGSEEMEINGEIVEMGTAAVIVENRTFVPVSRFARALEIDYEWNAEIQTVTFQ